MLNHIFVPKIYEIGIEKLRKELIITMNKLIEPVPKQQIVNEIDTTINRCIPLPCIDIIYEYQLTKSKIDFIDWSKIK